VRNARVRKERGAGRAEESREGQGEGEEHGEEKLKRRKCAHGAGAGWQRIVQVLKFGYGTKIRI
jgi:hypothetical protein